MIVGSKSKSSESETVNPKTAEGGEEIEGL